MPFYWLIYLMWLYLVKHKNLRRTFVVIQSLHSGPSLHWDSEFMRTKTFSFEPSSILAQMLFVTEKYPTKCLFINASSAVIPDTLVGLLLCLNVCYFQRTSRTYSSTDSYSYRLYELSFIYQCITCRIIWPQKLDPIVVVVQCGGIGAAMSNVL